MIRYLRNIDDPSIWRELQDVIGGRKSILLANLGFSTSSSMKIEIHPPTSWEPLLEAIVEWCVQNIELPTKEHFTKFSKNGHLEESRFRDTVRNVEEFLCDEDKRACFKKVLLCDQVEEADVPSFLLNQSLHEYLCQEKQCEDFLKNTYLAAATSSLSRRYKTYLQEAIDACRNQKPFIFELYKNRDNPVSTILEFNNQVLKSLSGNSDIDRSP